MRIVYVASEVVPFAKTGGLADVAGALPAELAKLGHDVCIFMPYYQTVRQNDSRVHTTDIRVSVLVRERRVSGEIMCSTVPNSNVPVYFVRNDAYYDRTHLYGDERGDYPDNCERFAFFCRALLEAVPLVFGPCDIFHCNDWQSALIPVYLKTLYRDRANLRPARSVLTIHNLAYQGLFSGEELAVTGLDLSLYNWRQMEFYGKLCLLKGGLVFADALTTVSERYSQEIQTPEYGCRLQGVLQERAQDLCGIINGVDYRVWDPAVDPLITARYGPDDLAGKGICKRHLQDKCGLPRTSAPVIALISRLTAQKGLDLIAAVIDQMMQLDVQLVVLGTGDAEFHAMFERMASQYPERISATLAFDNAFAHEIEAGADMFLMPSRYEPCGLNQFYSLRYGTVPIVRETGGLADSITDFSPEALAEGRANGFSFAEYEAEALLAAVRRAADVYKERETWQRLMLNGMRQDWSWASSAQKYIRLYEKVAQTCRSI